MQLLLPDVRTWRAKRSHASTLWLRLLLAAQVASVGSTSVAASILVVLQLYAVFSVALPLDDSTKPLQRGFVLHIERAASASGAVQVFALLVHEKSWPSSSRQAIASPSVSCRQPIERGLPPTAVAVDGVDNIREDHPRSRAAMCDRSTPHACFTLAERLGGMAMSNLPIVAAASAGTLTAARTALVVVVPMGMLCDAKLLRWRQWASEAVALGVNFHVLLDGIPSELPSRFWEIMGRDVRVDRMANETAVLRRFLGMKWGESQASGTPGASGAMKLQWFDHFPFYLSWWEEAARGANLGAAYDFA